MIKSKRSQQAPNSTRESHLLYDRKSTHLYVFSGDDSTAHKQKPWCFTPGCISVVATTFNYKTAINIEEKRTILLSFQQAGRTEENPNM